MDKLHRAGIAHRSLRAANVMAGPAAQLTIVGFSFSGLDATQRQMDLDVAELLVRKLLPSLRSSLASLWRVARSPVRLALLFGGSRA